MNRLIESLTKPNELSALKKNIQEASDRKLLDEFQIISVCLHVEKKEMRPQFIETEQTLSLVREELLKRMTGT